MIRLRHPGPWLFLAAALACAWIVATRLAVTSDMALFFPRAQGDAERVLVEQLRKGASSRLLLAAVSEAPPEQLAQTSKAMASGLAASGWFARVANGQQGLATGELKLLAEARYQLAPGDLAGRFTVAGLHAGLQARLAALASPFGALEKQWLPADPTGEIQRLAALWAGEAAAGGPLRLHGVWFSRDAKRSLLLLETQASSLDLDAQEQAVAALRAAFAQAAPPGARLTLVGYGVFALESRDSIRGDVQLLSALSTVLLVVLLYAAFRSLAVLLLVALPLLFGILVATAGVALVYGAVHGITLAFGVTLMGVAVDYPVHFFAHLRRGAGTAATQLARIWPTLWLGVVTTLVGFSALVFSEFDGLAQLGLFAVSGLLAAAATTRFVLPALTSRAIGARETFAQPGRWARLCRQAPRARWLALALALAAGAYLALTEQPLRDLDLAGLSPLPESRRQDERRLRDDLGAASGGRMLVVLAPDTEAVLRHSEALGRQLETLVADGALGGFDMAARYLPSRARQEAMQAALPPPPVLRARLEQALRGLPFRRDVFAPFLADVEAARTRAPLTLADFRGALLEMRIAPLLFEMDGRAGGLVLLNDVHRPAALRALAGEADGAQVLYLDIKEESQRLMDLYVRHAFELLAWGALVLYALVALSLRSLLAPVRVLAPPLAAVLLVSAALVFFGVPLTLFHLVSLLLVIGLGIDYALFFRRLDERGEEWGATFKALVVCLLTTTLLLGTLLLSQAPPLRAIGATVALGATLCFLLAAVWAGGARRKRV